MYKHILIPTDGSALSELAIRQGIAFAREIHAKVTALVVSPSLHAFEVDPIMAGHTLSPEQYAASATAQAEKYLAVARVEAGIAGVPCETLHVTIIDAADRKGCDLIFMASHGRKGISAFVLGSETYKVLSHSKIPVLVCR
jgi:nucleotide-binding universal stress UspA family protein